MKRALALLLVPALLGYLRPPPVAPVAPAAEDGVRVCGLGKDFHAGRRAELRRRVEKGALLFRGLPETRDYAPFRQDKVFWYLTGIESHGAALLMDAESGREVLFLPAPNKTMEGWDGEIWDSGDAWVRELTGFTDVRPSKELEATLKETLKKGAKVWVSMNPHVELAGCVDRAGPFDERAKSDRLDGRPSRERALAAALESAYGAEVEDVSPVLDEMRRVKQAPEIQALRRAAEIGALAMTEAMRATRPELGEWELDALMSFLHRREGADGPAYLAIVGSGANSCVLHYGASARRMRAGEVVLLDYGPEYRHYTTDITRTWPVTGEFTPRMAELYDAVLAAQAAGIAAVKPGRAIRDVERACSEVLKEKGFSGLVRHGACHYVGMEVHDVGDYGRPFEPGVVFTIEPGLYDSKAGIGVRIEDVVIVTEAGCDVISAGVPKTREAVSALVAESGALERLDAAPGR